MDPTKLISRTFPGDLQEIITSETTVIEYSVYQENATVIYRT